MSENIFQDQKTAAEAKAPSPEQISKFLETIWKNTPEDVKTQYLMELAKHEKKISKHYLLPPEITNNYTPEQMNRYRLNLHVAYAKLEKIKMKLYNKYLQPLELEILAKINQKQEPPKLIIER